MIKHQNALITRPISYSPIFVCMLRLSNVIVKKKKQQRKKRRRKERNEKSNTR